MAGTVYGMQVEAFVPTNQGRVHLRQLLLDRTQHVGQQVPGLHALNEGVQGLLRWG